MLARELRDGLAEWVKVGIKPGEANSWKSGEPFTAHRAKARHGLQTGAAENLLLPGSLSSGRHVFELARFRRLVQIPLHLSSLSNREKRVPPGGMASYCAPGEVSACAEESVLNQLVLPLAARFPSLHS